MSPNKSTTLRESLMKEFDELEFVSCPVEEKEPFFWRWSDEGKKTLIDFIEEKLTSHNTELTEKSYENGYKEALEKKYGIAMERIIKATMTLTIKELLRKIEGLRREVELEGPVYDPMRADAAAVAGFNQALAKVISIINQEK